MTQLRIILLASIFGLATACGQSPESPAPAESSAQSPAEAPAPAPTETPAPAPEVAIPAPAAESTPGAAPAADAAAAVEESAATETVAPADKNPLGKDIVLPQNPAPAAATAAAMAKSDWKYTEGEYYTTLPAAQGTSSPAGKIEVAEVFWYGCGHCYNLEPLITDWEKKLPPDVNFVRIPVIWNPANEIHGRVHYTADALGKLDEIRPAMFRAIHVDNKPMTEESEVQKLFEQHGVSAEDFNRTFRSFSVDGQLKRAKDLTVKYRVQGVPLMVVNGKYTTNGPSIRSHQDLLAVTEELVQRERQRN